MHRPNKHLLDDASLTKIHDLCVNNKTKSLLHLRLDSTHPHIYTIHTAQGAAAQHKPQEGRQEQATSGASSTHSSYIYTSHLQMMPAGGPPPALTPSPPVPPITTLSDPASSSSSSSSSRSGGSWLYSSLPPLLMNVLKACFPRRRPYLPFSEFLAHARDGKLQSVLMGNSNFEVRMKPTAGGMGKATPQQVYQTQVVPHVDRGYILELLQQQQICFGTLAPSWGRKLVTLLIAISPFLYLALVYRMMNKMYNPTDSVGKEHRTQKSKKNKRLITFKDVAGIDQAKLELVEIVSFLRDRSRYDEIGARLPKGMYMCICVCVYVCVCV